MNIRRVVSVAVLVMALGAPMGHGAAADPVPRITIPTELLSDATVTTDAGSVARMAAGDFLVPGEKWRELDGELRLYQREVPRLEAENVSMKRSLLDTRSTWYWVAGGFAAGFAAKMGADEVKGWF